MPALGLASRQDDRLFPVALRTDAARAAEVRTAIDCQNYSPGEEPPFSACDDEDVAPGSDATDHCITAHYPPAAPLPVLDPREDCVTQTY